MTLQIIVLKPLRFFHSFWGKCPCLILLLMMGICGNTQAQLFSNGTGGNGNISSQKIISDSSKKKQLTTDDKVSIRYFVLEDTLRKNVDSSIRYLHRSPVQTIWHTDLGNTGSAAVSLRFQPDQDPGMQLGLPAIATLMYRWQDLRFYNTTRAYTDIFYRNGSKNDQIISLMHTQNIQPNWNVSADYRKVNSPGFYKWQKTNHDNFALSTHYRSNNQRYDIKAGFVYNKVQQDENGGIASYDYLYSAAYNDKRLVPVYYENASENRSSVSNYFRTANVLWQQQYFFGQQDSVYNADSTERNYVFKPVFSVKHRLYTQHEFYRYKDQQPDTSDYRYFGLYESNISDSVYTKYFHTLVGNAFSLNGDLRFREKVMQAEVGYGIEIDQQRNGLFKPTFYNNYLFGRIEKPRQADAEWLYAAQIKAYFTGNTIGNFLLQVQTGRSMGENFGTILMGLRQSLQTAPYLFTYYASNHFTTTSSLSRQSITKLFIDYVNTRYQADIHLHYFLLGNYIYRDTNLSALQYKKVFPLTQLQIHKIFLYRTLVFDNDLLLQITPAQGPIQLPLYASRHRLAYEDKIFKRKLLIAVGLEGRYNTGWYANAYTPVYFTFVNQYQYKISNIPELAFFFNFNVKRFRASLALDQLQQIFTRNNINFPGYAAQNLALRFGLHWIFVN